MSLDGKNNVSAKLKIRLTTDSQLVVIDEGKENLFWEDFSSSESDKSFRATIIQKQASIVSQREIVKVIAKSGRNLTVVRAYEKCPLNDSATEHSQIAYEFNPWDIIYVWVTSWDINDIHEEIQNLENTKTSKTANEIITGEWEFEKKIKSNQSIVSGDKIHEMRYNVTNIYVWVTATGDGSWKNGDNRCTLNQALNKWYNTPTSRITRISLWNWKHVLNNNNWTNWWERYALFSNLELYGEWGKNNCEIEFQTYTHTNNNKRSPGINFRWRLYLVRVKITATSWELNKNFDSQWHNAPFRIGYGSSFWQEHESCSSIWFRDVEFNIFTPVLCFQRDIFSKINFYSVSTTHAPINAWHNGFNNMTALVFMVTHTPALAGVKMSLDNKLWRNLFTNITDPNIVDYEFIQEIETDLTTYRADVPSTGTVYTTAFTNPNWPVLVTCTGYYEDNNSCNTGIQVSDDGTNWTTYYTHPKDDVHENYTRSVTFKFPAGKYVRGYAWSNNSYYDSWVEIACQY